jgi:hypothetical protein
MPRSAHLKDIAGGLCGSFASRNNDLDGYWAIGKLRLLARQHGLGTVEIDLLAPSMPLPLSDFSPVVARYRRLLAKLADRAGIRFEEITAASVTVDFAPAPWPRAMYDKSEWGGQFILTVTVRAGSRADGIVRHAGYCRPHDPASERRSTRATDAGTALPAR